MPITKRPTLPAVPTLTDNEKAVADFIQGAPDSGSPPKINQPSESTEQITIRIPKAMLDRATAMAEQQGIPRASYIKRALAMQLQKDESKAG